MWQEVDNKLYRQFEFEDFVSAFSFLTKIAIVSEKQNHHPEIHNVYNKVQIWLSTHDAGNVITEKDRTLAQSIDDML